MDCEICSAEDVLRYNNIGYLCSDCVREFKMECTEKELRKYDSFSEEFGAILFGYKMGFNAGRHFGRQQESQFTRKLLEVWNDKK